LFQLEVGRGAANSGLAHDFHAEHCAESNREKGYTQSKMNNLSLFILAIVSSSFVFVQWNRVADFQSDVSFAHQTPSQRKGIAVIENTQNLKQFSSAILVDMYYSWNDLTELPHRVKSGSYCIFGSTDGVSFADRHLDFSDKLDWPVSGSSTFSLMENEVKSKSFVLGEKINHSNPVSKYTIDCAHVRLTTPLSNLLHTRKDFDEKAHPGSTPWLSSHLSRITDRKPGVAHRLTGA